MKIEILKTPDKLSREELSNIFKKATGFNFQSFYVEEFEINHNQDMFVPVTSVYCQNTGYSMQVSNNYSIDIKNAVSHLRNNIDVIGVIEVLLNNNAIQINQ